MKIKKKYLLFILIILSITILINTSISAIGFPFFNKNKNNSTKNAKLIPDPSVIGSNIIADIVEKYGEAVVNIDVTIMGKTRFLNPFADFDRFFGFGQGMDPESKRFFEEKMIPIKGAGSGFIFNSKKGLIITNEHVIKKADKIKVTLKDGRSYDAKVVGKDTEIDIAIIKIKPNNLPSIPLGDSEKIREGEWVIAIGNPYQFSNTVTVGIISATHRELKGLRKKNLIQTDAAINPGNSGGPLINLAGEVIGVNVAIAARAQGIGFAIPINSIKEIKDELVEKGKIIKPWLGIYMREVDDKIAEYLDLPINKGVIVTEVVPDSPAKKMGLKPYDIIKEINRKKIKSVAALLGLVKKLKPKTKVMILVYRNGHNKLLTGAIGEAP